MALTTTFQNDVLDVGTDHVTYVIHDNGDGTAWLEDVSAYSQVGDVFDASVMNTTNAKVNEIETAVGVANTEISQLQSDVQTLKAKFQRGVIDAETIGSVPAQTVVEFSATFPTAFSTTPFVFVCLYSTSNDYQLGNISLALSARSTTGFKFKLFNADTSARNPAVLWFAIA